MPLLQAQLPYDLTTFGLVLFAMTLVCFFLTGCVNPGVPERPVVEGEKEDAEDDCYGGRELPHPGESYSLSRDTNRCAAAIRKPDGPRCPCGKPGGPRCPCGRALFFWRRP